MSLEVNPDKVASNAVEEIYVQNSGIYLINVLGNIHNDLSACARPPRLSYWL